MFTYRICCCSATVASQVMACIAIVLCAIVAVSSWFGYSVGLALNIYQTVLFVTEVIACVFVFVACCTLRPVLVLPIIVIQALNSLSIIVLGIWNVIYLWDYVDIWNIAYWICVYALSLLISLFVLHCHVCCYKLLIVKKHAHHHHCETTHYA
ncbi:hypothetical protein PENTCL1PPCAC_15564 [Pristionchus entomophagus]|uniref:MARVEL domain-containing protein n=1 Tax=Pristionchus entomophagus TaxID=358040 RepID=A0AAV5TFQ6_9BILA|nr:hypothetical protein PENTCL1PPCAC_15564 [Pristionchus entomophagus]